MRTVVKPVGLVLHRERQAFRRSVATAIAGAARRARGARPPVAVAHPGITDAAAALKAEGVPCFALPTADAPGVRRDDLGLNEIRAGRIAASMIALAARRPVTRAAFVGDYRWREPRRAGVRSPVRERASSTRILDMPASVALCADLIRLAAETVRDEPSTVPGQFVLSPERVLAAWVWSPQLVPTDSRHGPQARPIGPDGTS